MQHFWYIMLYYFKKGKNTTEMEKKICAVYGEGAEGDRMCQRGLPSFVVEISHWTTLPGWVDQ